MRPALAMIAPLALAVACASAHAGPGAGSTAAATEVRATGAFHGISISTAIAVEVTIGTTTRVELRGPAAWLPKLETKVSDGILVISMPGNHDKLPKLEAVITTPDFRSVAISGAATVTAKAVTGDRFAVDVTGVGTLDLAGAVDTLRVAISGSAKLRAKNLVAETATVDIDGTGDATVHVTKHIDASISGVGNLAIYGKPTVRKRVSGTGVIALE